MKNIPTLRSDNKNNDIEKTLSKRIIQLEKELQYTKECLHVANEEFIVYSEELLNSNEELQTINTELLKANTQYQFTNQELGELNNDMTNYLNNLDIGSIFLDENLRIKKFTPRITQELNVKLQDIGRPISDITSNLFKDELNIAAYEVLKQRKTIEKEIKSKNGNWYLLKSVPYYIADNLIKGVIISLVDITRTKRAEINVSKSKAKFDQLVENFPYAIYIIQDGKFCFSNSAGLKLLNLINTNELISHESSRYFRIEDKNFTDHTAMPRETTVVLADGTSLLVELSAMQIIYVGKAAKLLFAKDTTTRIKGRLLEKENIEIRKLLNEKILSENLVKEFLGNLSHELRTQLNIYEESSIYETFAPESRNKLENIYTELSNILKFRLYTEGYNDIQ